MAGHANTNERVRSTAAQIMGVPLETLSDSSSPETVESWDSLKHMNLMLALEEEFGVRFSDDQIMTMSSIAMIVSQLHELGH